jgi:MOSC domain-containing protein YiiM
MSHSYSITLEHIYISPGHNYFGKSKDGPGDHPTTDVEQVEARAGRGLVGDRYFGVPAHYEAQVTFFAAEVFDALLAEFALKDVEPILTRRNIVTRGVNLNQLIGQEFTITSGIQDSSNLESGEQSVRFMGTKPCSPCAWMDASFAQGAHAFLRGRGGLRARILTTGYLQRGHATLTTEQWLDLNTLADPIARPRLP